MELIDGSETSTITNQTPGNYPKGNLLYTISVVSKNVVNTTSCKRLFNEGILQERNNFISSELLLV